MTRAFDPSAPLTPGITLLEASAGTGKTWGIENLVVRLVAEHGLPMRELLVVTYTRAATGELRDRVRARLRAALAAVEDPRAAAGDVVLSALVADSGAIAERARRLRDAEECFDECLVSTIHGFCQRMLQQSAFESGADFDLELVTDTGRLLEELVDDFLTRELYPEDPVRYAFLTGECRFTRDALLDLARVGADDPDLPVLPAPDEVDARAWEAHLADLRARWPARSAGIVAEIEREAKTAFANPRQRTFTRARVLAEVDPVGDWLAGAPRCPEVPPNADYWAKLPGMLAPGVPVPAADVLGPLLSLVALPRRLAACERSRFVAWARAELAGRSAARRLHTYQDLVRSLARAVAPEADPARRAALTDAIGGRFRAVLVDEFQDTDDLQWSLFQGLFGGGGHHLYLIGDPKQSIYGFRGANIHVYLDAKRAAGERVFTMTRNHRSDARLLRALNHVLDRPRMFGEEEIPYVPVDAPPREPADRLRFGDADAAARAPLQLRFCDAALVGEAGEEPLGKTILKQALPARVAADVVALLGAGATVADGAAFRPVRPGDLAVLVRTGAQAIEVQAALSEVGVPAVLSGAESVLASDEAHDVERWLFALEEAGRDGPARVCATSRLFGRAADDLLRLDAQEEAAVEAWDRWLDRLGSWRAAFAHGGFIRAFRAALDDEGVEARLLSQPGGERRLTNLRHVTELLHEAESAHGLQLAGLLAWLRQERARPSGDAERLELRLERDDDAARVMTVHKSKGLQFPIVFAPYLWDTVLPRESDALVVPDPERPRRRILDLRADRAASHARAVREKRAEGVRDLYVALTRARYRCVVYLGHVAKLEESPVAAVFHGEPPPGGADRLAAAEARGKATRAERWAELEALVAGATDADGAPTIALTRCLPSPVPAVRVPRAVEPAAELLARGFMRAGLDPTWRRYSYSALTAGRHAPRATRDAEVEGLDVDAVAEVPAPPDEAPRVEVPDDAPDVPLARFPAGPAAGTFLHEIFERADFAWAREEGGDLDALHRLLRERLPIHGFDAELWAAPLAVGLRDVLRTPLGGPLGDARLCDVPRGARFDELRFDFPIAGGIDAARGERAARVRSEDLVRAFALRKGCGLGPDDERVVRRAWLDGLGGFGDLAGFMTGSIDLVMRHPVAGHPRWFVVDWKSNRLDPWGQRRWPVEHFGPDGMRWEMEQHDYYLQYHIYALALHRYLRWRVPGYDYDRDFGGVYYLFFRGMIGPSTPERDGVRHGCFHDRPPRRVIEALDAVFQAAEAGAREIA